MVTLMVESMCILLVISPGMVFVVTQSPCGQNPYHSQNMPCFLQWAFSGFGLIHWAHPPAPGACSPGLRWHSLPLLGEGSFIYESKKLFPFFSAQKSFTQTLPTPQHTLRRPWGFLMNLGVFLSPLSKG